MRSRAMHGKSATEMYVNVTSSTWRHDSGVMHFMAPWLGNYVGV